MRSMRPSSRLAALWFVWAFGAFAVAVEATEVESKADESPTHRHLWGFDKLIAKGNMNMNMNMMNGGRNRMRWNGNMMMMTKASFLRSKNQKQPTKNNNKMTSYRQWSSKGGKPTGKNNNMNTKMSWSTLPKAMRRNPKPTTPKYKRRQPQMSYAKNPAKKTWGKKQPYKQSKMTKNSMKGKAGMKQSLLGMTKPGKGKGKRKGKGNGVVATMPPTSSPVYPTLFPTLPPTSPPTEPTTSSPTEMPSETPSAVPTGSVAPSDSPSVSSAPSISSAPSVTPPTSFPTSEATFAPFMDPAELAGAVDLFLEDSSAGAQVFDFFGPIEEWDVSLIRDFSGLFSAERNPAAASFNANITAWDTSNADNLGAMFFDAAVFNQPIGDWDTSNVEVFSAMFFGANSFNRDISSWDVSSGQQFDSMFAEARNFDQDISQWDVSSATDLTAMFRFASFFLQDLCPWGGLLDETATVTNMFQFSSCDETDDPVLGITTPSPFCAVCPGPSPAPSLSSLPSAGPSPQPSVSAEPTMTATERASAPPSLSVAPSTLPSGQPSTSAKPSTMPSSQPSLSSAPSTMPSSQPSSSVAPSAEPSIQPSLSTAPSTTPSSQPSSSVAPSMEPSIQPSLSAAPSTMPSSQPSSSVAPSTSPSLTAMPTTSSAPSLSQLPSLSPTESAVPSVTPSLSVSPSSLPSSVPSGAPSETPSTIPTGVPSEVPSASVTAMPTDAPSKTPSEIPSDVSSMQPTTPDTPIETEEPTASPSNEPSPEPQFAFELFDVYPGVEEMELFGFSVDMSSDGSIVLAGAYENSQGATTGGRVDRIDTTIAEAVSSFGFEEDDSIGFGTSISGDASLSVVLRTSDGVLEIRDDSLDLLQEIGTDLEVSTSVFKLSRDGNWLVVVGDEFVDDTTIVLKAKIYEFDSGSFSQFGSDFDIETSEIFGTFQVDIIDDGSVIAITQVGDMSEVGQIGSFRTISRDDENQRYTSLGSVVVSDTTDDDFGQAVELAITEDGKLIAALGIPEPQEVALYLYDETVGDWVLYGDGIIEAGDEYVVGSAFGYDLAFDETGKRLLVGARCFNGSGGDDCDGAVQAFDVNEGQPTLLGNILAGPSGGNSFFGESVAMSADGNIIAVGAPEDCVDDVCAGSVWVFEAA